MRRRKPRRDIFIASRVRKTHIHGGAIAEVDDSGGHHMDSGIHRHQFRLLRVLIFLEVPPQHLSAATQLPRHRQRHGQGLRLVLWPRSHPLTALPRLAHRLLHGLHRLRPPVARHQKSHHLALFSRKFKHIHIWNFISQHLVQFHHFIPILIRLCYI